ncbi:MAG: flagellar filament capping protein FliD [Chitinispirillales bacterium]|jgi:flagellar hook-associated protein 2|nr:flagellar filament capping protein FliD [Chitinispirillales bacterium]
MALDMKTQMRLTGMASGLDTDAVIANLGKVHTMRIDKVKQDKQVLQWRQEMYRDTISKLSNFMKSNLNVSNPNSNFRSSAAFAKFTYMMKGKSNTGIDVAELMSITANGDIKNFTQTVQKVTQLATKDSYAGKQTNLQGITTKGFDYSKLGVVDMPTGHGIHMDPDNNKYAIIGISIDGTTRNISISTEELLKAYDDETGGAYRALVGLEPDSERMTAIKNVVDKIVYGQPKDISGLYMRKVDGNMGAVTKENILEWYQSQKNVEKFEDPDSPTPEEIEQAIKTYFNRNAIYNTDTYRALKGTEKDAAVAAIFDSMENGNGGDISGFSVMGSKGFTSITSTPEITLENIYNNYKIINNIDENDDLTDEQKEKAFQDFFKGRIYVKSDPEPRSNTQLVSLIDQKIKEAFGAAYGGIVSSTPEGELKFQKTGSIITLFDPQPTFDAVSKGFGLKGGASSGSAVTGTKLIDMAPTFFDEFGDVGVLDGGIPLKINGVTIKINRDDTIGTLMNKINNSDANVTLSFTASTNTFSLTSKLEGTANTIKIEGIANQMFFAEAFGFDDDTHTEAVNFIGTINGEEYMRQSNTFTHEGVTFTFYKTFDTAVLDSNGDEVKNLDGTTKYEPIKLEVNKNTAEIVKSIKTFVDEYNELVTHINDLIKGKRIRKNGAIEYPPLTEEERKALSPEEVKLYDEKAKLGLMANESDLRKLLSDMRTSLYQKIDGVGLTLADIGITTSADYMDGGTLVVDENKLKAALDKDFEGVVSLFTKSSSIPSTEKDSKKLAQRAAESGIAQRLNDIFTAAAGTSTGGEKGYLLKKAGMVNDRTQVDNAMTKQLNDYDKKIDKLLERWYRQENNYYAMFARMETAMSKLQAQQNSLAQIMAAGGGGGK